MSITSATDFFFESIADQSNRLLNLTTNQINCYMFVLIRLKCDASVNFCCDRISQMVQPGDLPANGYLMTPY